MWMRNCSVGLIAGLAGRRTGQLVRRPRQELLECSEGSGHTQIVVGAWLMVLKWRGWLCMCFTKIDKLVWYAGRYWFSKLRNLKLWETRWVLCFVEFVLSVRRKKQEVKTKVLMTNLLLLRQSLAQGCSFKTQDLVALQKFDPNQFLKVTLLLFLVS